MKRRFRFLADQLVGSKIQGIVQIGDLEGLEKELDSIVRKFDYLGEKCVSTEDVENIRHETENSQKMYQHQRMVLKSVEIPAQSSLPPTKRQRKHTKNT